MRFACGFGVGLLADGLYGLGMGMVTVDVGIYGLCDVIVSTWTCGTVLEDQQPGQRVLLHYAGGREGGISRRLAMSTVTPQLRTCG